MSLDKQFSSSECKENCLCDAADRTRCDVCKEGYSKTPDQLSCLSKFLSIIFIYQVKHNVFVFLSLNNGKIIQVLMNGL